MNHCVRLPGSGKTTLAKALEGRLRSVRFSPDEWMDALSLNLWDDERRAKIEALQWPFDQELLALGLTVIIEWGTWGRASGTPCGSGLELLALPSSCTISPHPQTSSSTGFNAGAPRSRQSTERCCPDGSRYFKHRRPRRWHCPTSLSWQTSPRVQTDRPREIASNRKKSD
jgi:hypothetical protein